MSQPLPSLDSLRAAVDPIADQLAKAAVGAERARKPDDDCIAAIEATGLFALLVPRAHGGHEARFSDLFDVVSRLGEGCTSTAWVASFYAAHAWIASLFPVEARAEFFAERPWIRAPAPLAPTGTAKEVDGGYELTGRWRWATGIMHADWTFAAALCQPAGRPPEARVFALRASEVKVVDTWHVSGMAATGSNDIVAEGVFVPAYRTIAFEAFKDGDTPGAADHASPLYRTPMPPMLAFTAALPALGAARAAVDSFQRHMKLRYMAYENKHQDERPAAQIRLAQARASVDAAELLLRELVRELETTVSRRVALSVTQRAKMRMTAATAVNLCKTAIETLTTAAGSSACFLDHPLQRAARDVNVLSTHVIFDWDGTSEMYGRVLLGRKPGTVLV